MPQLADSPTVLGTIEEIVADIMWNFDLNPDDPKSKKLWEDNDIKAKLCSVLDYKLEIKWRNEHPLINRSPSFIKKPIAWIAVLQRQQLVWKTKLAIDEMFMPPSDQPSRNEIERAEVEAAANVRTFAMLCLALYFSPHVVDYARRFF